MAARGFPNQIPEFNGSSWSLWVGRLQFYFEANNITDLALKRANLLTLCGEQTCDTVSALIQPSTPAAVSYDDIVAALQKHYDPRPSEVYSRARFQRRDQLERETASAYIAALKKLAAHCDFGTLTTTGTRQERDAASSANTTMPPLDVMLRDRFVSGLSDESLQQRMFSEKDLTFNKAYDIAVRADSAGHQQREMRRNTEPVHQTSNQVRKTSVVTKSVKKAQRCWRCDDQHIPQECRFQSATCNFCHKRGHIERACINKRKLVKIKSPSQLNHNVDASENTPRSDVHGTKSAAPSVLYDLNTMNLGTRPKIFTEVSVHDQLINFEVDSGAACTLISEDTFRTSWPADAPTLQQDDTHLRTWSDQNLPLLGSANVRVNCNGKTHTLPLLVVKGSGSSLLGRNWFASLGVTICGIHQTPSQDVVEQLQGKYETVFSEEIPGNEGPLVTLELLGNAQSKFLKARPVPFALRASAEKELGKLEQQGCHRADATFTTGHTTCGSSQEERNHKPLRRLPEHRQPCD
ncbi:hypothetical protein V5799_027469 [Amblyomma americanum]|uniref:Retropepsins domain-containing protein n=1 Tax=Amblyomma americanum TaxID=6943 RepID=A0AAQ4DFM9_AMBAM